MKLSIKNLATFAQCGSSPFGHSRTASTMCGRQQSNHEASSVVTPIASRRDHPIIQESQNSAYSAAQSGSNRNRGMVSAAVSPNKQIQMQAQLRNARIQNQTCGELVYLLQNQKQCLARMKSTVEKDKQKIDSHFNDFKHNLNNIVDDLKLSIIAQIQQQYNGFLHDLQSLKADYIHYCNLKKQFWDSNQGTIEQAERSAGLSVHYPGLVTSTGKVDNEALIGNLLEDLKQCKNHMNYKEFERVQEKKLRPLLQIAKELTQKIQIDGYYKPDKANEALKNIRKTLQDECIGLHHRMQLFLADELYAVQTEVFSPDYEKQASLKKAKSTGKLELNKRQNSQDFVEQPFILKTQAAEDYDRRQKKSIFTNSERCSQIEQPNYIARIQPKQKYCSTAHTQLSEQRHQRATQRQSQVDQLPLEKKYNAKSPIEKFENIELAPKIKQTLSFSRKPALKNPKNFTASPQPLHLQQVRCISDRPSSNPQPQTSICVQLLDSGRQVAVGTKTGTIKVFCTKTGAKLTELTAHKASVCSLTSMRISNTELLISGGDIGCCQVVVWDAKEGSVWHSFNNHRAAVTSILEMGDQRHIVTGSFDKSINIYNIKRKQLVRSIGTGEKVTILCRTTLQGSTSDEQFIVSGHLNSQVCIWRVLRNSFHSINNLQLVNKVNIGTIPYSIVPCGRGVLVAGKDSWVRLIDVSMGTVEAAGEVGQCEELALLDGNGEKEGRIVGFFKGGAIKEVQIEQGEISAGRAVGEGSCISFSCGVGPKIAVGDRQIYMANHRKTQQTEIKIWRIGESNPLGLRAPDNALSGTY